MVLRAHDIYRAVADPTRRAMLDRLMRGDCPAGELAPRGTRMSQPALSQHLRVLREARLVKQVRHGRQRVYSLQMAPLRELDEWLDKYRRFWDAKLAALGKLLEENP
jgi:DNA-binding transcriptional ArsR family regulator